MPERYCSRLMDIRQLRYFVTLARTGNFGRAAAALHIAQPALSRQIRQLEEELGVQLFERHARGASPTEAADVLLSRAEFLLKFVEQTREDVTSTQREPQGPIGLGMSPGLALTLAEPLYSALHRRFPQLRLRIVEAFTGSLQDQLLRGAIDLAILNGSGGRPNLVTVPLMREQICLIGPRDSPHLFGKSVRVADLAGIPFVFAGMAQWGVREIVEKALENEGVSLVPRMEVESIEAAKRVIRRSDLCTAHFAAPIFDDIETGDLRAVPIEGLYLERSVARASDRPVSRAGAVLREQVQLVARELVHAKRWPFAVLSPPSH